MKIVNADTIQTGEKDFIDAINAELDWMAIEKMILEKHKLQLQDEVCYKQGDIVVHDNQIAYRLDFDITVSLSLTFNREGDCLNIETPDEQEIMETPDEQEIMETPDEQEIMKTPDEQEIMETPDGQEIMETPDGQEIMETPDGREIMEAETHHTVTEQKNWSKTAPELAEMINHINQDSI